MKKVSFQKTNRWLLALLLFSGTTMVLQAQVQYSGTINTGNTASAIGYETQATGDFSFSGGYKSFSNGHYSFAFGNAAVADKGNAIALGYMANAFGNLSLALGQECYSNNYAYSIGIKAKANGDNSFAIGRCVENNAINSIVIGISQSSEYPVANNSPNSIAFGINTSEPTLFIKGANAPNSGQGNVGVCTTNPVARFQVADGDIFIQDIDRGIIMKSPDGSCWRGTLNNSGQLEFVKLPDCENFTGIKTNEAQDLGTVKVFPNPSNGYIDVKCSSSDCLKYNSLSLYTSDGHLVFTQPFSGESARISTNSLQAGTYVIKLSGRQNSYSDIIVVSH